MLLAKYKQLIYEVKFYTEPDNIDNYLFLYNI